MGVSYGGKETPFWEKGGSGVKIGQNNIRVVNVFTGLDGNAPEYSIRSKLIHRQNRRRA